MISNRVSATLSVEAQQNVMSAIATIRENLPFFVDLTITERGSLSKLGDASQAFARKAFEIGNQHAALLPQGLLEEMRRDSELFEKLQPIQFAVDLLAKQVDDTRLQVGAEYYAAARTIYAAGKSPFAQAAMRNATGELGKRFGRRSRSESPDEPQAVAQHPESPGSNAA